MITALLVHAWLTAFLLVLFCSVVTAQAVVARVRRLSALSSAALLPTRSGG